MIPKQYKVKERKPEGSDAFGYRYKTEDGTWWHHQGTSNLLTEYGTDKSMSQYPACGWGVILEAGADIRSLMI